MELEKEKIKIKLNRQLDIQNLREIHKLILAKDNINYSLVDNVIQQYIKKINLHDDVLNKSKNEVRHKNNTILKNKLIIDSIEKQKQILAQDYSELKEINIEIQKENIEISNHYSIKLNDIEDVINSKVTTINKNKKHITDLTDELRVNKIQLNGYKTKINKKNEEILYIYKYSFYILLLCHLVNYCNLYPISLQFMLIIFSYSKIYYDYNLIKT